MKKNDIKTSNDLFEYLIVQHVNRDISGVYHADIMKFIDDFIVCWVLKKTNYVFSPISKDAIVLMFVSLANRYNPEDKKSPTYHAIIKYYASVCDGHYKNSFGVVEDNKHSLRVANGISFFAGWMAKRRCVKYTKSFVRALKK